MDTTGPPHFNPAISRLSASPTPANEVRHSNVARGTRETCIIAVVALGTEALLSLRRRSAAASVHVLKDPNYGCCSTWIEILGKAGFDVTADAATGAMLTRYKTDHGIPLDMISCHTAKIDGYMIEGHVPVSHIRRPLDARPDAIGHAVQPCPMVRRA